MTLFCSTTKSFKNLPAFFKGHWYLNENGDLFIVPNADAKIAGNDQNLIHRLHQAYCLMDHDDVNPVEVATQLDLAFVPHEHRHFSECIGYYCI